MDTNIITHDLLQEGIRSRRRSSISANTALILTPDWSSWRSMFISCRMPSSADVSVHSPICSAHQSSKGGFAPSLSASSSGTPGPDEGRGGGSYKRRPVWQSGKQSSSSPLPVLMAKVFLQSLFEDSVSGDSHHFLLFARTCASVAFVTPIAPHPRRCLTQCHLGTVS